GAVLADAPSAGMIPLAGAGTSTSDAVATAAPPLDEAFAIDEAPRFAPVYPFPRLELVAGRGAWVTDRTGRRYRDFVSGIAVNALGHAAPAVARAVAKQARELAHVSNLFANRPAATLAAALTESTGYPRVFF